MIFKSDSQTGDLNGFLDSGSRMEGELRFDTTFRIDGTFSGKIISDGNLVIGEGGEVDAEVRVGQIFISGVARGEIHAQRRIHLAASGRAYAHLETPTLVIEEGALFEGRCTMTREGGSTGSRGASGEGASVAKLVKPLPAKGVSSGG